MYLFLKPLVVRINCLGIIGKYINWPRASNYLRYCVGLRENSNSFPPVRYSYKPFRPIASTD
jgi:hypothetical protein